MKNRGQVQVFPIGPILESYGADITSGGSGWRKLCCPFHNERNASATMNESANRFHCFVCLDKSEDAIGVVMWQDGVDFKRAVEICESITSPVDGEVRKRSRRGLSDLLDEPGD